MALHVREPQLVRWWLLGLALTVGDRFLPLDIRLGTAGLAGIILLALPIIAFRRISQARGTYRLQQRLGYRIVLGGLALAAAAQMVMSVDVAFVDYEGVHRVTLAGTAAALLVIAVLAWRATVRPSPRAAAATSLIAMLALIVARIGDAIIQLQHGHLQSMIGYQLHSPAMRVADMCVAFLLHFAGIAALVAFEPANDTIPEARVSA